MADDKRKEDDYTIEMNDASEKDRFIEPPKSPRPYVAPIPAAKSIMNHPLTPVLSYCASSIMMTVLNKYVLSPGFSLNFFLLGFQGLVCVLFIQSLKIMGLIQFRDFNSDEAKKWFPVSLALIGMIYTGSKAIQYLSIPVYTIFKNITIIITAYGEVLWFGGSVTRMKLFSFGLIVLSSVVAAWADIQHAIGSHGPETPAAEAKIATLNAGYMWMLVNCFCTSSYLLFMKKRMKMMNFKDYDTMFYNNLLTLPLLAVATFFLEDWSQMSLEINFPPAQRTNIFIAMVVTGLGAAAISYTSAWCVRVTSGATYSMVGALNKLPIAVSGLIFFDAPVTLGSVSAIAIGFSSGIVYSIASIRQAEAAKPSGLPTTNQLISASSQSARDSLRN